MELSVDCFCCFDSAMDTGEALATDIVVPSESLIFLSLNCSTNFRIQFLGAKQCDSVKSRMSPLASLHAVFIAWLRLLPVESMRCRLLCSDWIALSSCRSSKLISLLIGSKISKSWQGR